MKPLVFLFLFASACIFTACQKDIESSSNNVSENRVPVAEAGPSQNIIFPVDSLVLNGSGTDQDGNIVAYLWSQVAGPVPAIIRNPGSASTLVKFPAAGNFKFQLMVVDNKGATGVDTTSVNVTRPPSTTVTLNPANNANEINIAIVNGVNQTGPNTHITIAAWTSGGPYNLRQLIKFDLTGIPQNATITSANLYLYSYPPPTPTGNFTNANFGANNAMFLEQVTAPWTPASVGWFNIPAVNTSNQILIPHTPQSMLDLNIDVKDMIASMVNNNANYGFLLRLQNEVTYHSRIFVSSFNTTYPDKRPKLVVTYQ